MLTVIARVAHRVVSSTALSCELLFVSASHAASQVRFLLEASATTDFDLTQIVSHHEPQSVARFIEETG